MPRPLTVEDLDSQMCCCNSPDCERAHLYFHSRCHPEDGLEVSYKKGSGELVLKCQTCKKLVANVAISHMN